jgi:YHS domain-containing protein
MKMIKNISALVLTAAVLATPLAGFAADSKPDKMTTCPVSGEKLGEMGKPVVFDYKGQEVKLCCKDCRKDFDKDPAKYIKKIQDADKPAK